MSTLTEVNTSDNVKTQRPELAEAKSQTVIGLEEITKLLPHRYPFLLVDRIIEYVPGEKAVGIKNVTCNEPYFQGHFPGRPVMPGVLITEAMAQVCGVLLAQMPNCPEGLSMLTGIDKAKFRRPVVPGDQLRISVKLLSVKRNRFGKMECLAEVDGQKVAEGELMFSIVD